MKIKKQQQKREKNYGDQTDTWFWFFAYLSILTGCEHKAVSDHFTNTKYCYWKHFSCCFSLFSLIFISWTMFVKLNIFFSGTLNNNARASSRTHFYTSATIILHIELSAMNAEKKRNKSHFISCLSFFLKKS